jgi:hypothetical protein
MTSDQTELFDAIAAEPTPAAAFATVLVHFARVEDVAAFEEATGRQVPLTGRVRPRPMNMDDEGLLGTHRQFHRTWSTWNGMPEFHNEDLEPALSIPLTFEDESELTAFEEAVGSRFPRGQRTGAVWYPKAGIGSYKDKRYVAHPPLAPRYPLYVVSKGRADIQLSMKYLTEMGLPHYVVVEEDQLADYQRAAYGGSTFLVLDPEYKRRYDRLTDPTLSPGSGAARNFAWDHSIGLGAERHWVMDDNIRGWHRLNRNLKTRVADGTIFRCMEDFTERYANVAMAGPNYFMFAVRKASTTPPFYLNTRIYSCNLIRNDLPFRWRGRYNEDTILSLDLLKAGWCTILFNAFLQYKEGTQKMAGGNTTELYGSGTLAKSQMLVDAHPDVARLTKRFHDPAGQKRDHHVVDYKPFLIKNALEPRADVAIPDGVDNYGMVLERIDPQTGAWVQVDTPWYPWEDGR